MVKITPSILAADFTDLKGEIARLEEAGAEMIHIDVMDGLFVPNLTFGPPVIKQLRQCTQLPFDVHLMIDRPELSVEQYIDAGADYITFHLEACQHVDKLVRTIKDAGVKAGVALLPTTTADSLQYIISELDLVLVMSVNPGFGGQKFLSSQLHKIQEIKSKYSSANNFQISVDGGINNITAKQAIAAGVDILVAGSYVFNGDDMQGAINQLRG